MYRETNISSCLQAVHNNIIFVTYPLFIQFHKLLGHLTREKDISMQLTYVNYKKSLIHVQLSMVAARLIAHLISTQSL